MVLAIFGEQTESHPSHQKQCSLPSSSALGRLFACTDPHAAATDSLLSVMEKLITFSTYLPLRFCLSTLKSVNNHSHLIVPGGKHAPRAQESALCLTDLRLLMNT